MADRKFDYPTGHVRDAKQQEGEYRRHGRDLIDAIEAMHENGQSWRAIRLWMSRRAHSLQNRGLDRYDPRVWACLVCLNVIRDHEDSEERRRRRRLQRMR